MRWPGSGGPGTSGADVGIPAIQKIRLGAYIVGRLLSGDRRFPLVLMLEPLFRCNLRCPGCGKIAYPDDVLARRLSVAECVAAAEECKAPVVSIPGGEPLLHPEIPAIVRELVARRRFVYLCTNGLLVERRIGDFGPSAYLTFNVHLDGLRHRHDVAVNCPGVFDAAVAAIRLLVSRGFRVTTNTTFFAGETAEEAARFFDFVTGLGVEAMTVAAAFGYEKARDQERFPGREDARKLFQRLFEIGKGRGWRFNHSGLYLDFLAGNRDYPCSPWATPARNVFGWQRPCYLIEGGYAATYKELLDTTDWERFGPGRDRRCAECLVHSGFEPSAVLDSVRNPLRALRVRWCGPGRGPHRNR
jgi:hopanoid biosynthesis associated radical SAM protein HpnH